MIQRTPGTINHVFYEPNGFSIDSPAMPKQASPRTPGVCCTRSRRDDDFRCVGAARTPVGEQQSSTTSVLCRVSPSPHPALLCVEHRRMAVIFRDARNVVISEHRMRVGVFNQDVTDIGELEPFIRRRFKVGVLLASPFLSRRRTTIIPKRTSETVASMRKILSTLR